MRVRAPNYSKVTEPLFFGMGTIQNEPDSVTSPRRAPVFTEKSFYLEEFYGKSLMFVLIPPGGERLAELDSLNRTLRELKGNQTRCIAVGSTRSVPRLMRRLGRLAPRHAPLRFNPATGLRSRPYPPDSAVAALWQALQTGPIVVAEAAADEPGDVVMFAQQLASRLRVFKLLLLDRDGGLVDSSGNRHSFVQIGRVRSLLTNVRSPHRRALVRAAYRAIEAGVASVSLISPREVYEELFSFSGTWFRSFCAATFSKLRYKLERCEHKSGNYHTDS